MASTKEMIETMYNALKPVNNHLEAENERLNEWMNNLETAANLESDTIRIRKFKAIKDGKTLEQVLKDK